MCEDGGVIQHLVRSRLWTYSRLALDGLKTIVFLENSPTLCIASGNVWFDYPQVANVGCISHKTLYLLAQKDTSRSAFDWPTFHDGDRLCLRLSNIGYTSRSEFSPRFLCPLSCFLIIVGSISAYLQ